MTATAELPRSKPGPIARPMHALIRLYRLVFAGRISPCRFLPTCSEYALEALELHGAGRGSWLILRRLGRCHPWGGHGIDPVPAVATKGTPE